MRRRRRRKRERQRGGGRLWRGDSKEKRGRGETIETSQERTIFCPSAKHPPHVDVLSPFLALENRAKTLASSSASASLPILGKTTKNLIESQRAFLSYVSYTLPKHESVPTFTIKQFLPVCNVHTFCKAFWNFIDTIEDYLGNIWRKFENVYMNYDIFNTNIYITKLFKQPIINIQWNLLCLTVTHVYFLRLILNLKYNQSYPLLQWNY